MLGVILLAIIGLFAAGISALSTSPAGAWAQQRKAVAVLLKERPAALAAVHLGRSLATIGFIWLVAPAWAAGLTRWLAPLLGDTLAPIIAGALALVTLALLLVILIQQGVSAIAGRDPAATLGALAGPLYLWWQLTRPLTALLLTASQPLQRLAGSDHPRQADGLTQALDKSIPSAELDEHEKEIIRNVFAFRKRTAGEVMVPRTDVVWLAADQPLPELLAKVRASGHSRFPLCEGSVDNVIGYLHAKDLAPLYRLPPETAIDWRELARPVIFVPETGRAVAALRRLQRERSHLAVVVDEFGGMAGIVTVEDLLEELVGEIEDEFDEPTLALAALGDGEWIADGTVRLEALKALGLTFGEAQEETVGGYIFGRLAREVSPGDEVTLNGAVLRVEAVDGLRVTRVRITTTASKAEEGQTQPAPAARAELA